MVKLLTGVWRWAPVNYPFVTLVSTSGVPGAAHGNMKSSALGLGSIRLLTYHEAFSF